MRIAGQATGLRFGAETAELILAQAAFQIRAGINTGGAMPLDVDQVRAVRMILTLEEMVEADVIERRRRSEAGDVATDAIVLTVGMHDHGGGVPADQRANLPLQRVVAVALDLAMRRNRVDVGRIRRVRNERAASARALQQGLEQVMCALGTLDLDNGIKGVEPFAGFRRVRIGLIGQRGVKDAAFGHAATPRVRELFDGIGGMAPLPP